MLYNRFKLDMSKYPHIDRIDRALNALEAFKKAHPNEQPDCPEDQKV
jgi:hypothetical protein